MKQGNSVAAVNLTALTETLANDLHCVTIHRNVADALFMSNQSSLLFTSLIPRPPRAFDNSKLNILTISPCVEVALIALVQLEETEGGNSTPLCLKYKVRLYLRLQVNIQMPKSLSCVCVCWGITFGCSTVRIEPRTYTTIYGMEEKYT